MGTRSASSSPSDGLPRPLHPKVQSAGLRGKGRRWDRLGTSFGARGHWASLSLYEEVSASPEVECASRQAVRWGPPIR